MEGDYDFISIDIDYEQVTGKTIENWPEFFDNARKATGIRKLELINIDFERYIEQWCDLISRPSELALLYCCHATSHLIDKILESIRQNESITSLKWQYEAFNSDQFLQLAEIVLSKPQITNLDIFQLPIDSFERIDALCRIIESNQLSSLTISGCFNLSELDPSTMNYFFASLNFNNTLEYFSANNIGLQDNGTILLAKWLEKCPSIRTLIIRDNNIGAVGYKAILEVLANNCTLEELYISSNLMDPATLPLLQSALERNETLHVLDLTIDDNIQKYILAALETNETLTSISEYEPISVEMKEKLEQNKNWLRERPNWAVIIHNIARQDESFELFPSEIWNLIFGHLKLRKLSREIFTCYNRSI